MAVRGGIQRTFFGIFGSNCHSKVKLFVITLANLSENPVYLVIQLICRTHETKTWDLTPGRVVSHMRIGITIPPEVCLAFAYPRSRVLI